MIVYDLQCGAAGHRFEGWFASSDDHDSQAARGLLSCPVCGTAEVRKAAMAPRLSGTDTTPAAAPPAAGGTGAKAMLAGLARAQAEMLKGSDDVGDRFVHEARAIHDGDRPDRPIHGRATLADARDLAADGIAVMPLPLPVRPPGTEH